jgi:hypothetical protein
LNSNLYEFFYDQQDNSKINRQVTQFILAHTLLKIYVFYFIQLKLTSLNLFHGHQDFRHIHARIVCVLRLLLFVATRSAPLEKIRSTGTLVA